MERWNIKIGSVFAPGAVKPHDGNMMNDLFILTVLVPTPGIYESQEQARLVAGSLRRLLKTKSVRVVRARSSSAQKDGGT